MLVVKATVFSEQFLVSYMVIPVITYSLDKLVFRQYLSNNPGRFIESNTENSWNEYRNNMSMQGTWCNALFVQAAADCQNVAIHIIELEFGIIKAVLQKRPVFDLRVTRKTYLVARPGDFIFVI